LLYNQLPFIAERTQNLKMTELKITTFLPNTRFLFLLISSILIMTNCTHKTRSDKKTSSIIKLSQTEYDSITELNHYLGTYQIKAVHHLGKNYKNIPSKGRIRITKTGMRLITDLDLLENFEAEHDKTNLIDISKGKFIFKSKINELTMLSFEEEKNMIVFSNGTAENSLTTIFVYIKED